MSDAHPHSSGNKSGSYADNVERPDAQFGGIGRPFAPPILTAPLTHMTTPHFVTNCPKCFVAIKWHYHGGDGICAGCGTALTTHPVSGHPMEQVQA